MSCGLGVAKFLTSLKEAVMTKYLATIQVLTARSTNMSVFWVLAQYGTFVALCCVLTGTLFSIHVTINFTSIQLVTVNRPSV